MAPNHAWSTWPTNNVCHLVKEIKATGVAIEKQRTLRWNQKENMMTKAETYSQRLGSQLLQTRAECHQLTSTYEKRAHHDTEAAGAHMRQAKSAKFAAAVQQRDLAQHEEKAVVIQATSIRQHLQMEIH